MTRPTHHHAFVHPVDVQLWPQLAPDQPVSLINERGWRLRGTVETLTNDRQCLWIQLDAGMGRQLIHHQDGFMLENTLPGH
ncbi:MULTISPECIES: hypothetical protein [Arthrobacter]|uniref:hypothetical protein n=1 Tax=Arthrobacter TaxID=1663 RepID=UPI0009EAEF5F|nr:MULTISPECIES: hypothetical protein [Arthrobacter]